MIPQSLSRFLHDNALLFLMALGIGCYVYGLPIVNFSLSIDEEGALLRGTVLPYLSQGRWGISLIRTLLVPDVVLPYLPTVNTVLVLSLNAVGAASVLRLERGARYLFAALFMALPQFAYIMQFSFLSESIALGMGVGLGSFVLFRRFLTTRKALNFAGSVVLGAFVTGIYQSLLLIPATLFMLDSLRHALRHPLSPRRYLAVCLWFMLYGILSLLAYALVTCTANTIFQVPLAEYITEFSAWTSAGVLRCLHDIFIQYWVLYTGNAYFGEKIFLTIWIPVIGLLRLASPGTGASSRLLTGLIMAGALVGPFAITFAMGHALPARIFVAQALLFAGIWAIFMEHIQPRAQQAVIVLGLVAVVLGAANVTRLFQSDIRVAQADSLLANNLVQRLYDVCPDLATRRVPVHLAGNLAAPFPKLRRSQTFGSSFFHMGPETPARALTLIKVLGMADLRLAPTLSPHHQEMLAAMPVWPDPGAVRLADDVLLVKLSEPG